MPTVDPTTPGTVLVTGATGCTGRRVLATLRAADPAPVVRAASRSGRGADAVAFDWYETASHDAALAGADRVYLLLPVGDAQPAMVVLPFLERAARRGLRHVVLLSAAAVETGSPGIGEVPAALPDLVPASTVLRPSWFMQNFLGNHHQARSLREHGEVVSAAGDGRVPFVDVDDIAAVAAATLLAETATGHRELLLTGPEALTYDEVAAQVGRVSGRPVRHRRVDAERLARRHLADLPPDFADFLAGLDVAISRDAFAATSDDVEAVTGRPPRSFRDFAERHRDAWSPAGSEVTRR